MSYQRNFVRIREKCLKLGSTAEQQVDKVNALSSPFRAQMSDSSCWGPKLRVVLWDYYLDSAPSLITEPVLGLLRNSPWGREKKERMDVRWPWKAYCDQPQSTLLSFGFYGKGKAWPTALTLSFFHLKEGEKERGGKEDQRKGGSFLGQISLCKVFG